MLGWNAVTMDVFGAIMEAVTAPASGWSEYVDLVQNTKLMCAAPLRPHFNLLSVVVV